MVRMSKNFLQKCDTNINVFWYGWKKCCEQDINNGKWMKKNGVKILPFDYAQGAQDFDSVFYRIPIILFTLNELHGIHCNYIFLVGGDNDGRNLRIGG